MKFNVSKLKFGKSNLMEFVFVFKKNGFWKTKSQNNRIIVKNHSPEIYFPIMKIWFQKLEFNIRFQKIEFYKCWISKNQFQRNIDVQNKWKNGISKNWILEN